MSIAVQPSPKRAAWRKRALLGVGIAAVVVVIWSALLVSGLPAWLCLLVTAVLAGVTASLASQPVERPVEHKPEHTMEAPAAAETMRQLRHDLRGILSPALITADRLLMTTQDPIAKRAAEAMIDTVERAERRLSA